MSCCSVTIRYQTFPVTGRQSPASQDCLSWQLATGNCTLAATGPEPRISRSTRADFRSLSRCSVSNRRCTASSSRAARSVSPSATVQRDPALSRRPPQELQRPAPNRRAARRRARPAHEHRVARRHHGPGPARSAPSAAARAQPVRRRERRIDALQPQNPVLEIPGQRVDRRTGRNRVHHRRPKPVQAARRPALPAPTRRSARQSSRHARAHRRDDADSGDRCGST